MTVTGVAPRPATGFDYPYLLTVPLPEETLAAVHERSLAVDDVCDVRGAIGGDLPEPATDSKVPSLLGRRRRILLKRAVVSRGGRTWDCGRSQSDRDRRGPGPPRRRVVT